MSDVSTAGGIDRPAPGTIIVRPVLAHEPVFWTPDYWAPETHACDGVRPETPLSQKPWAEFEVSLDVTLGEVWHAACDAWGIRLGPGAPSGESREAEFWRFSFVRPDVDANGVPSAAFYQWPDRLPVARAEGNVEQVRALDITYRELLVSSSLGLIEGDVRRPYVGPVRPQGDAGTLIEILKLTREAIHAAYGEVDDAVGMGEHTLRLLCSSIPAVDRVTGKVAEEGGKVIFFVAAYRWCRRKLKERKNK